MAGILQVFSFLVIPALIGRLYSLKPFAILMTGWIVSLFITIAGIALSYKLYEPTAPVIVAGLAFTFFFLLLTKFLRTNGKQP